MLEYWFEWGLLLVFAFAKAQLPIVLASSRMPSAMRYLQDLLSISDQPLIAYNGGLILGSQQKLLQSHTFGLDVLKAVMTHHRDNSYNLSIYSHDHWFTDREDYWSLREINNTRVKPTYQPATESLQFLKEKAKNIHKLMCMGGAKQIEMKIFNNHLEKFWPEKNHQEKRFFPLKCLKNVFFI